MPKKFIVLVLLLFLTNFAYSNNYYVLGTKYLNSYQYTSAIEQFKNAIRQYPEDYNSRIGLINAYSARASYNFKTLKDYQKTLNDLRSALFYIKYYGDGATTTSLQSAEASTNKNIKEITTLLKSNTSPDGLLTTAKTLRNQGELPSSFVVYQQLMNSKYDKEASIASGDILKVLRNPSLAIVFYNKILRLEPNNFDLLVKIGECYQEIGNTKLAADNFNKALSVSSNSDAALNNLEKIWRKQIYKNPADAEAHANLGVIYQQKGDFNNALSEYQKANQLNPNNMNTKLNLGTLYQEQKNYENAISMYDKVLYNDANNIQARIYKAQCLKALNKTQEALIEYKRVLALDSKNINVKKEIIGLASNAENPEEIISMITDNIQNNVDKSNAYYQVAYDFHNAKKYDLAKKFYLKSLAINSNQPEIYLNLSDIYLLTNDKQSAINILKEGKTFYPTNKLIADKLEKIMMSDNQKILEQGGKELLAGNYEKALSIYKSIQPQTAESLLGIASTYQTMENYPDAISYYKMAYDLDLANKEILYYIAMSYSSNNDLKNAKIYVNKLLEYNPNHKNAKALVDYINEEEIQSEIDKALDLYNDKQYQDAYNLLTELINQHPQTAIAYYYRGIVQDEMKKYEDAISDYKNTIKYDSKFNIAYYSIAVDYDNLKDYKSAFDYYNQYLDMSDEENEYTQYVKKRVEDLKKYVPNLTKTP